MAADAAGKRGMTLPWLSVAEIATAYKARRLSPVELVTDLLARIERLQPRLHVFTRLDASGALAAAQEAEADIAGGRHRGPLHGIPVGIKDVIDVAGLPTSCHSRLMQGHIATEDAGAVSRLREAGAIVMGKLSTHEFALGGPSFDLPFPPARNPWNPEHHPGGSSSGSGAGLAAGLFPLALGTDTGGSIRHPASACGIVGLKPTYGLVSCHGVFPVSWTLDHVGPMARTVADAAALLEAMAGYDTRDPCSADRPAAAYGAALDQPIRGLRVGFVRRFHERDMVADPQVAAALEEVAAVLAAEGARISTVDLPPLAEFAAANRAILTSEVWAVHAPWLRTRAGEYGQLSRQRMLVGAFLRAEDLIQAQRRRQQLARAVNAVFREVDVLLLASSMDPPCRIEDADEIVRTYPRQARTPFNLTGHPALAMMCGLSGTGLPLSVQFAGPLFGDAQVLRVAAAYERATGWHARHPALD